MSAFVKNLTIAFSILAVAAGVFIEPVLRALETEITNTYELRWLLIVAMPVLLALSYLWQRPRPTDRGLVVAVQSVGQLAIFLSPYLWVVWHAQ